MNFEAADLRRANFASAETTRSSFRGAVMEEAVLQKLVCVRSNFRDARLAGADLEKAEFHRCDLAGAALRGANLSKGDFGRSAFDRARPERRQLPYSSLARASLRGAKLDGTDFSQAYLFAARLRRPTCRRQKASSRRKSSSRAGTRKRSSRPGSSRQRPGRAPTGKPDRNVSLIVVILRGTGELPLRQMAVGLESEALRHETSRRLHQFQPVAQAGPGRSTGHACRFFSRMADAPCGIRVAAALATVLLGLFLWILAPAKGLTHADIEAAVQRLLDEKPPTAADAYETILPSVVHVRGLPDAPDADVPSGRESQSGTGVVIVDTGVILTNLHVVQGAKQIKVTFHDGTESDAAVIGVQPEHDLAVLQAKTIPDDLISATLRSTAGLRPGERWWRSAFPSASDRRCRRA